ncbi:MAG: carbon-nitrogen hydrolase family protein [Desulfobulbus sp.]|nr:carbon-nitrogen hydrolase family protein [Desulfobulbus sp.]
MPSLTLGLLHMAIQHKEPEQNRQQLFDLIREAGERGMQLIVAPELAISGYSFTDRGDMEPYAETADGPTLTGVAALCRNYGMYACIGMAERDTNGAILFNSAFVIDPRGDVVCRYRKMNAEFRWACPGNPCDDNTFLTPSVLISAQGAIQLQKIARTSRLVRDNVLLNRDGSLKGGQRLKRLANRNCEQIQACYLDRSGISDLTSLLQLPKSGQLQLCCHCPDPKTGLYPTLAAIESSGRTAETLHILPSGTYEENDIDGLHQARRGSGNHVHPAL